MSNAPHSAFTKHITPFSYFVCNSLK